MHDQVREGTNTCFVIMPYGVKTDVDGQEVDFDEIFSYVIESAVEDLDGFNCVRCDNIDAPGWIHDQMLRHIYEDRVALVDTSTLNANVFYELGVRHALKRGITILIHREGTTWPFNIAGLKSIKYTTNPRGVEEAKQKIRAFITNALDEPDHTDSLVYKVLPDLRVERGPERGPQRLTRVERFEYPLTRRPECLLGLISGDRENITVGDVWVNSENTDMQMDRYYGTSTSATIRYLGARKHPVTGKVEEDTIGDELSRALGGESGVAPAGVVATGPGELSGNGVKWIFHVAAVVGEPREGYRPIERIERCVTSVFRRAAKPEFADDPPTSIMFPIFGTGPGGGDLADHARRCIDAAVEALEDGIAASVRSAYFYVWSDAALEACQAVIDGHDGLQQAPGVSPDGE
jgi:O-acetyl-ADP-ribose deacetylase (regulator of RNase III)